MPLTHCVELNAITLDRPEGPQLTAHWSWASALLAEPRVRELAQAWFDALMLLANHAGQKDIAGLTPSDLPLVSLSQLDIDLLEEIAPGSELEEILPLSPLQEGLLFHGVFDGKRWRKSTRCSWCWELSGEGGGVTAAGRRRRLCCDVTRTCERISSTKRLKQPVQVILGGVPVPWQSIDLTSVEAKASSRNSCNG